MSKREMQNNCAPCLHSGNISIFLIITISGNTTLTFAVLRTCIRIKSMLHNFDVLWKQSLDTLKSRFIKYLKLKQKKTVESNSQQYYWCSKIWGFQTNKSLCPLFSENLRSIKFKNLDKITIITNVNLCEQGWK